MSDSLWPHEPQNARLPCPSISPWICTNSYLLNQWCHPTISSFVTPFSSSPQFSPASGSFPVSPSGGQNIGASASASVLPMNIQSWFLLGLTGLISLQSKKLSGVFSSITVWKHQFFRSILQTFVDMHLLRKMVGSGGDTWGSYFSPDKDPYSQSYDFSSSHVWMWELDHKEASAPQKWCIQIVVLEETLKSPLECKGIKPVNPKRNQPWILIGNTDVEDPVLWPPDVKRWITGKDPDAGKDKAGWEEGDKGWVGWMASPTQWTGVWANSGRYWRTGNPGVL